MQFQINFWLQNASKFRFWSLFGVLFSSSGPPKQPFWPPRVTLWASKCAKTIEFECALSRNAGRMVEFEAALAPTAPKTVEFEAALSPNAPPMVEIEATMLQNAPPMVEKEAALSPNEANAASSGQKGRRNLKLLQARQDAPIRGLPETPIVVFGLLASSVGSLAGRPNIQICPCQGGLISKKPYARAAK